MPRHSIEITLPSKPIKNADTVIDIWSGQDKLGQLRISKGTVDWRRGAKKTWKYISWEKFAKALDDA